MLQGLLFVLSMVTVQASMVSFAPSSNLKAPPLVERAVFSSQQITVLGESFEYGLYEVQFDQEVYYSTHPSNLSLSL
jgi:hypothetical protein